jgi:ketosteroid isomerase-like protein
MNEQSPLEVVQEAYAAFTKGDLKTLLNLMAEDVKWFLPGPTDIIPFAGLREGRESVGEFFRTLARLQDATVFEPTTFIAQEDKVVAIGHYNWQMKNSDREYASHFAHYFIVRDGKIAEFEEFYDTGAVTRAYSGESADSARQAGAS